MTLRALLRDPVFRGGLALRIALVALLVPVIQEEWFVAFLRHAIDTRALDPWSTFISDGGSPAAYPYGPAMFFAHAPMTLVGWLASALTDNPRFTGIGFRLGLLAADFSTLLLLSQLFPQRPRALLWLYWWSPIVLYVTYWNGQTDIVPVALLLLALHLIRRYRPEASGGALAIAIAAKLSMVLAVPFMGIYLWRNKRLRSLIRPFALWFFGVLAAVQAPWLLSPGFRQMVLGTQESGRLFDLAIPVGTHLSLYLTPLLYVLAVYGVWRLRRISFELLMATIGLSFFVLVLATPAPPGWYLWLVPFLVAHQLQEERATLLLTGSFTALVLGLHLVISPGASMPDLGLDPGAALAAWRPWMTPHLRSLGFTLIAASGVVLVTQMLRERVSRNDYYRIAQKPVVIGIAGDSGAGKDTLSRAIAGIFGEHSVVHVSGDDYHVWDRFAPMWKGLTHLDPRANDLHRFNQDVLALTDGKAIVCRRYDHTAGRFLSPTLLGKNDVVIASGLHALHAERLRRRFDVGVFLDIDEGLRRAWKIQRDVHERGHGMPQVLQAIERRALDADRHIHPQKAHASLVLRLMPVNAAQLHSPAPNGVRLKLVALIRASASHERVARILIGVCGLHLDLQTVGDAGDVEMTIEGDVVAEDVDLAARKLVPDLHEMFDITPLWEDGVSGVMQLLVLVQIQEALKSRLQA